MDRLGDLGISNVAEVTNSFGGFEIDLYKVRTDEFDVCWGALQLSQQL